MAENTQNIIIKYNVDATELRQAERALGSLTAEERELKSEIQKAGNEVEKQADSVVASTRKQSRSIDELQRDYNALKGAIKTTFDPAKVKEYNKALKQTEKQLGEVNQEAKKTNKGIGGFSDALKGAGKTLIAAFAVEKIIEAGQAFATLEKQIAQTRGTIQRFSKTQGETLDNLTARVRALASTYGLAEEELIKVVNAFSKQSGEDFADSLSLIEKGYLQVGNASGEFSDSIREYTKLLIDAGATAEEVIKIAAIQDLEGVFNDKLIDSIFNFSNELKDSDKALKVLTNTFGREFAVKAVGDFNKGTATALDILQRIGEEAQRTGKSTLDLAQITTDLGTGVTEDIGGINEVYRLYNEALKLNADSLDPLGVRQAEVLRVNQLYEASLVRLTGNFEGFGATTEAYAKGAGRVLANLLSSFVELFDDVDDRLAKFKEGLGQASPEQLGKDIERTQNRINILTFELERLQAQLDRGNSALENGTASGEEYRNSLNVLNNTVAVSSSELAELEAQLALLIEAKGDTTEASKKLEEQQKKENVTTTVNKGLIAELRKEIADLTKQREAEVSEGQILRLNNVIKLRQEELKRLLSLSDAKKKETAEEVARIPVAQQVNDEILNAELTRIEKIKKAEKVAKQDFINDELEKQARIKEGIQAVVQQGIALITAISDFRTAQIDGELSQLKKDTDARIALAGDNAKAIEKIQAESAKKEQQLLEKQAQIRKNAQIQQAIIAGVQGVVQAISRADLFPFNFVLAGLVAATTAVQIATIKSTPAFAEGTEFVQGAGTSTSDSINARLSKGERVVKASTNKELRGISNDELPNAVRAYTTLKQLIPTATNLAGNATGQTDSKAVAEAIRDGFDGVQVTEVHSNEQGYARYQRSKNSRVRIIDKNNSL